MSTLQETPPEQVEQVAPEQRLTARTARGREVWALSMKAGANGSGVISVPRVVRQRCAALMREKADGAVYALSVWTYARDRFHSKTLTPALITQQEIADELGISTRTVQRVYATLMKAGLLETEVVRYRGKDDYPKTAGEYLTPLPVVVSSDQSFRLTAHGSSDSASESSPTTITQATTPPVQSVSTSQQHVSPVSQHDTGGALTGGNTTQVAGVITRSFIDVSLKARNKKTEVRFISDAQVQALDKAMKKHEVAKLQPLLCWAYGVSSVRELSWDQCDHAIKSINDDSLSRYLVDISYRRRRVNENGLDSGDAHALRVGGWAELSAHRGHSVVIDTSNTAPLWTDEQWLRFQTAPAPTPPVFRRFQIPGRNAPTGATQAAQQ